MQPLKKILIEVLIKLAFLKKFVMKLKSTLLLIVLISFFSTLSAQAIEDGQTIDIKGYKVTFTITNQENIDIRG